MSEPVYTAFETKEKRFNDRYGLTWTDKHFDNNSDVLAVFDIDYDRVVITEARRRLKLMLLLALVLFLFLFYLLLNTGNIAMQISFCFFIVFLVLALSDKSKVNNPNGLHLAVTREGVLRTSHYYPYTWVFRAQRLAS